MILWTVAGLAGVFLSLDLFLFYFFFEMMLIPMYFLIAVWGHEKRVYAAIKFFIFTQVSGLLMLVAIIALVVHPRARDRRRTPSTSRSCWARRWRRARRSSSCSGSSSPSPSSCRCGPLHTWLPTRTPRRPTAGSVLLAGVLIKIGAYGMLRFMVPLFPDAVRDFRTVALILGVIGIIYGAVMAYGQNDMKRLVAYTSVSHMGFVLLGVFAWNTLALQGVILQLVCHALSTGALFIMVGGLQDRIHTRDMDKMGGLWQVAPRMGGTAMFFAMASLGLPGLGNFVAEFLILVGVWQVSHWAAVLGAVGLVFATVYALWMMQRAFQGEETHSWSFADLTRREVGMFGAMIAALVLLGFWPQPLITTARQTVTGLQQMTAQSTLAQPQPSAEQGGPAAGEAAPPATTPPPGEPPSPTTEARAVKAGDLLTISPLIALTLAPVVVMLAAAFWRSHGLALALTLAGLATSFGMLFVSASRTGARRHAARHHGRLRALLHRSAHGGHRWSWPSSRGATSSGCTCAPRSTTCCCSRPRSAEPPSWPAPTSPRSSSAWRS